MAKIKNDSSQDESITNPFYGKFDEMIQAVLSPRKPQARPLTRRERRLLKKAEKKAAKKRRRQITR